jgi:hypothetical protein
MLMQVKFPIEPFNTYVKDGSVGAKMQKIMGEIKPEAAYFTAIDGHRGGILVVNLEDASQIPALAEPFFLVFHATAELHPAMTPEDLGRAGLEALGKKWG